MKFEIGTPVFVEVPAGFDPMFPEGFKTEGTITEHREDGYSYTIKCPLGLFRAKSYWVKPLGDPPVQTDIKGNEMSGYETEGLMGEALQQYRLRQRTHHLRSEHQKRVDQFMILAKQDLPGQSIEPSEEIRKLRAKLMIEETFETVRDGLGIDIYVRNDPKEIFSAEDLALCISPQNPFNMIELIDGCCDIKVVTTGTLSACGIPDEPFQKEVDENNLAKFGPGGHRRDDGKWIKPPNHKPPKIKEILEEVCLLFHPEIGSVFTGIEQAARGEFAPDPTYGEVHGEFSELSRYTKEPIDDPDFPACQETRMVNRKDGCFLVLNLRDPDPHRAHAAWLAAREFKKEIKPHGEENRMLAKKIDQVLIAIQEEQPPLKSGEIK